MQFHARGCCVPQELIDEALGALTPGQRTWAALAADHRLRDHQPLEPRSEIVALVRQATTDHRASMARDVLHERDTGELEAVRAAIWLLDLNQPHSPFLYDCFETTVATLSLRVRQRVGAALSIPPDDITTTAELRDTELLVHANWPWPGGALPNRA